MATTAWMNEAPMMEYYDCWPPDEDDHIDLSFWVTNNTLVSAHLHRIQFVYQRCLGQYSQCNVM